MENFIEKTTNAIVRVIRCKVSRRIVIVALEDQDMKRVVMRRKNRLKRESIIIENDLT